MQKDRNASFLLSQSAIMDKVNNDKGWAFYGPTAIVMGVPNIRVFKLDEMSFFPVSFTFPVDSEFLEVFDYHLLRFRQNGLLSIFAQHHMYALGGGQTSEDAKVSQLSFQKITSIIIQWNL